MPIPIVRFQRFDWSTFNISDTRHSSYTDRPTLKLRRIQRQLPRPTQPALCYIGRIRTWHALEEGDEMAKELKAHNQF
jgi:hypothetical protein